MRYVLYEGENSTSTFVGEISFIESYMALMRRRYPEGKIDISLEVPQHPSADILVPPMIFVTFVENAFKHGVSYQAKSRVCVSLKESDESYTSHVKIRICVRQRAPKVAWDLIT
jgi:LytS/YehU family sensor histidine kinase